MATQRHIEDALAKPMSEQRAQGTESKQFSDYVDDTNLAPIY